MKFIRSLGNIHEYLIEENGLKVLLAQQPELNSPVVTLMIRYNVGSRNEGVGYTGSAHVLEHLLFKGSKNYDSKSGSDDIWKTLKPLGALMNATTSKDRTNFFETLPLKHLETALKVEADRMESAFIRNEDRTKELIVVRNEFEIGENNPEELLYKKNWALAFEAHPYHHSVIGHRDDIENVPIERLQEFYREYYNPENAVVIVSGQFNLEPVAKLVEKHFSPLTRNKGTKSESYKRVYTFENGQQGPKSFVLKKAGASNTIFSLSFKKPRSDARDSVIVDMLIAVLGDGKKSRLYKQFVQNEKLFTKIEPLNEKVKDTGIVQFYFTLNNNTETNAEQNMQIMRSKIMAEIRKLSTTITDDEIELAKKNYLYSLDIKQFTSSMQMANFLNEYETLGEWSLFVAYKKAIAESSKKDFIDVLDKYFQIDYSIMGMLVPVAEKIEDKSVEKYILKDKSQQLLLSLHESSTSKDGDTRSNPGTLPQSESFVLETPIEKLPQIDPNFIPKIKENIDVEQIIIVKSPEQPSDNTKEDNGEGEDIDDVDVDNEENDGDSDDIKSSKLVKKMTVTANIRLLSYKKISGEKIHLFGYLPAGHLSIPAFNVGNENSTTDLEKEKLKIVSSILPAFLSHGTRNKNAEAIEAEIERMDSSISFSSDDYYHYFSIRSIPENFVATTMLAFDMLFNSLYEQKALDEIRQLVHQQLMAARQDPESRAAKILSREIYPRGHRNRATETGIILDLLKTLTVDDFKQYAKKYYALNDAVTIIKVGAATPVPISLLLKRMLVKSNSTIFDDSVEETALKFTDRFLQLKSQPDFVPEKNKNIVLLTKNIPEKTSTSVLMSQRVDQTFSDRDRTLLTIGVYALGGAFDSRLMQRVRVEKGLTYGIRSHLSNFEYNSKGELLIRTSFAPENVDAGIIETKDVVAQWIAGGISEEELRSCKSYFDADYQVELERSSSVMSFVSDSLTNEQPLDFFSKRIETIKGAKLSEINNVIKKYIDPNAFVIVKAGTLQQK